MLVQMPRGSSGHAEPQNAGECNNFEAALRRDLATAPVVSYDPVVGGWTKLGFEFFLVCASAPVWGVLLLAGAAWRKLAAFDAAVFAAEPRVGYGGKTFSRFTFARRGRDAAPPEGAPAPANDAGARDSGWAGLFEGLPMLINVLRGEMALVGPAPLPPEAVETVGAAQRHYLSARPGLVGLDALAEADAELPQLYKTYAKSWSLTLDMMLLWEAAKHLRRSARPPG